MLAEQDEFVIGGDPDRDTVDLAVVDSATGALRAHLADRADGAGYARMLAWADSHAPGRRVWALEGTGSFAAGLAVFLAEAGEDVVEIGGSSDNAAPRTTRSTLPAPPGTLSRVSTRPRCVLTVCQRRYG